MQDLKSATIGNTRKRRTQIFKPVLQRIADLSLVIAAITLDIGAVKAGLDDLVFKALSAGSSGSAFIVGPAENGQCILLTAYHVIADNAPTEPITFVSTMKTILLYRKDFSYEESLDIAIAPAPNCESSLNVTFAKAGTITISSKVLVKGFPLSTMEGHEFSEKPQTALGRITSYTNERGYDLSYDAPTKPGLSGGPVVSEDEHELLAIHGRTDTTNESNEHETRERFRTGGRGISAPQIYRFAKEIGYILPRSSKSICLVGVC